MIVVKSRKKAMTSRVWRRKMGRVRERKERPMHVYSPRRERNVGSGGEADSISSSSSNPSGKYLSTRLLEVAARRVETRASATSMRVKPDSRFLS